MDNDSRGGLLTCMYATRAMSGGIVGFIVGVFVMLIVRG